MLPVGLVVPDPSVAADPVETSGVLLRLGTFHTAILWTGSATSGRCAAPGSVVCRRAVHHRRHSGHHPRARRRHGTCGLRRSVQPPPHRCGNRVPPRRERLCPRIRGHRHHGAAVARHRRHQRSAGLGPALRLGPPERPTTGAFRRRPPPDGASGRPGPPRRVLTHPHRVVGWFTGGSGVLRPAVVRCTHPTGVSDGPGSPSPGYADGRVSASRTHSMAASKSSKVSFSAPGTSRDFFSENCLRPLATNAPRR